LVFAVKRLKVACGVGRSAIRITVAPALKGKGQRIAQAVGEEQLGRREHHVGFAQRQDVACPYSSAVQYRLPWVWTVPLGLPVEPEEYSQKAASSASVSVGFDQWRMAR
jgi:hypothetical protein